MLGIPSTESVPLGNDLSISDATGCPIIGRVWSNLSQAETGAFWSVSESTDKNEIELRSFW